MNLSYTHPTITFKTDDEREQKIVAHIVNSHNGQLKASCPTMAKKVRVLRKVQDPHSLYNDYYDYATEAQKIEGEAAFVWRWVAFQTSRQPKLQCMPVTADFYLGGDTDERKVTTERLLKLVDRIVNTIPMSEWHGIQRWGKVFGY